MGKYDSATEAMRTLHWLPIHKRSQFKIACLVYQALFEDVTPKYLKDLVSVKIANTPYNTRLAATQDKTVTLDIPKTTRKTFAERSFSVAGPRIWNDLPKKIKQSQTYNDFKRQLKTFYFNEVYG